MTFLVVGDRCPNQQDGHLAWRCTFNAVPPGTVLQPALRMLADDDRSASTLDQLNDFDRGPPCSDDDMASIPGNGQVLPLFSSRRARSNAPASPVYPACRIYRVPQPGRAGSLFDSQVGRRAEIGCDNDRLRMQRNLSRENLLQRGSPWGDTSKTRFQQAGRTGHAQYSRSRMRSRPLRLTSYINSSACLSSVSKSSGWRGGWRRRC